MKLGRRPANYPPGPPTLPIIGNLHQIPQKKQHLQFERWAREYGPIYSLMLGTKVMIVLNSDVCVKDLVDKRGAIYSSRPDLYIGQHVLSGGLRILFMPTLDVWKMARKAAHRVLNITAARTYVPYQDLENKAMLVGFLDSPGDFVEHIRRYTASLTTQMTFGFRTTSIQNSDFKEAFDIFDRSSELIGSRMAGLLDLLPALRRIPAALLPIKKEAQKIHQREIHLFRRLFLQTKGRMHAGTAKKKEAISDDLAAYLGGSLLQAGSETTASILVGFVQAMTIFPEIAIKAQEELDRICGDRMPDLNDVPDLPYVRACIKESLRWMPGFMLGVPHAVTQDDVYMGYQIPAGAMVIINAWAIQNDPKRHPCPRRFEPMRYWGDDQTSIDASNNPDPAKRDHFVFGAGRRKCQGMHIADRSLFLAVARLLWAFQFKRAIDESTGLEIVPDMEDLAEGVMMFPRPFKTDLRPRTEQRAECLRKEWKKMEELLDDEAQWKVVPEGLIWKDEQEIE
ncbi:hypothetical protein E8E14_014521 [Neopestalotiopsis sp. 37M]|nr:hypothetical protein E8E14_014521 [Neopestalotiopsis sp. 37M]